MSNRKCELIDVRTVRMDRYPMNPSTLRLIDFLRKGGTVPPIKVAKHPNGGFVIRDGRHRMLAYKLLGRKQIKAKFSDTPLRTHYKK